MPSTMLFYWHKCLTCVKEKPRQLRVFLCIYFWRGEGEGGLQIHNLMQTKVLPKGMFLNILMMGREGDLKGPFTLAIFYAILLQFQA